MLFAAMNFCFAHPTLASEDLPKYADSSSRGQIKNLDKGDVFDQKRKETNLDRNQKKRDSISTESYKSSSSKAKETTDNQDANDLYNTLKSSAYPEPPKGEDPLRVIRGEPEAKEPSLNLEKSKDSPSSQPKAIGASRRGIQKTQKRINAPSQEAGKASSSKSINAGKLGSKREKGSTLIQRRSAPSDHKGTISLPNHKIKLEKKQLNKAKKTVTSSVDKTTFTPSINGQLASPLDTLTFDQRGISSLRMYDSKPLRNRKTVDIFTGLGPNEAASFSASASYMLDLLTLGLSYQRAHWLDPVTNTGKFSESTFVDICAGLNLTSSYYSLQPCLKSGVGRGVFKNRSVSNEITQQEVKFRSVRQAYVRFVLNLPRSFALEGSAGISEDVFLYGPFIQSFFKTPWYGVFVGVEAYRQQRILFSLGWTKSFE